MASIGDGVTFPYAYMCTDELAYEEEWLDDSLARFGDSEEEQEELQKSIEALEMVKNELYRRAVWEEKAVKLRDLALSEKDAVQKDAYETSARYFAGPHCRYEGICEECFLAGYSILLTGGMYLEHAKEHAKIRHAEACPRSGAEEAFAKIILCASGGGGDAAYAQGLEEQLWEHLLLKAGSESDGAE